MRREVFRLVENMLRDFPRMCEALKQREEYLESKAYNSFNHGCAGGDKRGSSRMSPPELVTELKLVDREYRELLNAADVMSDALNELPDDLYRIVSMCYFNGLMDMEAADEIHYSEYWVRRLRQRAVRRLVSPCLTLQIIAEGWRRRETERQFEVVKVTMRNLQCAIKR